MRARSRSARHTLTLGTTVPGNAGNVVVNSGGTFSAVSSDRDAPAIVQASDASNYPYGFDVKNGGTIAAGNAQFTGMNSVGIYVEAGAFIDGTNNFSGCSFDHRAATGPMLRIENTQTFTMTLVSFSGTAAPGVGYNIQKNVLTAAR